MSDNVNEDLIEATIRRVAGDKAALKAAGDAAVPDEVEDPEEEDEDEDEGGGIKPFGEPSPGAADEDLIEATIRRVAEDKAALHAAGQALPQSADDEGEPEDAPSQPAVPAESVVDDEEDRIAATILRVAEEQARKTAEVALDQGDPDGEPLAPTVSRFPPASRWSNQPTAEPATSPEVAAPIGRAVAEGERIMRMLDETNALLKAIAARLDAALPLIERLATAPPPLPAAARPAPLSQPGPAQYTDDDDDGEWDEAPQPIRAAIGDLAPNILRDRPGSASFEEHATDEIVDTRPLPEPPPPLHVDSRRGMELLPRTYRITVEDKRHGVDLVPLHRALLGMEGVRDMSLLNYTSAAAIVSLETVDELQPELLERSVSRAMARAARVEVHNEHSMVVKLAEE